MAGRMGALCRYADGGRVRGYAEGGLTDPDDEEDYGYGADEEPVEAGRYIEGLDDPAVAQGALSIANQSDKNPAIRQLEETGAAFPHGAEITGGLNQNKANEKQAYDAQRNAILTAMRNLATAGQGPTNMPLYMAAAGMLKPTRTGSFGESIGNAAEAAAPEILRERELDRQNAIAASELGIKAADVGVQQARGDLSDFYRQIGMGEKIDTAAATRQYYEDTLKARAAAAAEATRRAQIAAASRTTVAEIMAKPRLEMADLQKLRQQITYLGPKAGDPNTGLYLNRFTGDIKEGSASTGTGAATTKEMQDLQFMVSNHIAPDLTSAWAMRRAGVNDGATFQRLIQQEKNILLKTPQGSNMTDTELEHQARENVVARQQLSKSAGQPAPPGGAPPPPAPGAPARIPPRPDGVPPTARYSPSQKAYWWQDSAGKWQHKPVP